MTVKTPVNALQTVDEHAPICPVSTSCALHPVDELAPIRSKTVHDPSNRFIFFKDDEPSKTQIAGNSHAHGVPISEFIRPPSKRQERRIKDYIKLKQRQKPSCAEGCKCEEQEYFPVLKASPQSGATERESPVGGTSVKTSESSHSEDEVIADPQTTGVLWRLQDGRWTPERTNPSECSHPKTKERQKQANRSASDRGMKGDDRLNHRAKTLLTSPS